MDSVYYYLIWGFMGILLGILLAAIVTFNFLHKKLQELEDMGWQDHATILIIEERTRHLVRLPAIDERTRSIFTDTQSIDKQITDKNPVLRTEPLPLLDDGHAPTISLKRPRVRA